MVTWPRSPWLFQMRTFRRFGFSRCVVAKRHNLQQKCLNKWIGSATRNAILYSVIDTRTDRQTDRQTDGIIMPIVDHTVCSIRAGKNSFEISESSWIYFIGDRSISPCLAAPVNTRRSSVSWRGWCTCLEHSSVFAKNCSFTDFVQAPP